MLGRGSKTREHKRRQENLPGMTLEEYGTLVDIKRGISWGPPVSEMEDKTFVT